MDSIEKWLKSLRLHKYSHLFTKLNYDQLLAIDEDYLMDKNITKGARNKMLLSIRKLNLREEKLVTMCEDIDHGVFTIKQALTTLKEMLITPIQMGPEEKLSNLIVEKLEQVAQRIPFNDNQSHALVNTIVDEILRHDSFTKQQKAKVAGLKIFKKVQKANPAGYKQSKSYQPSYHQRTSISASLSTIGSASVTSDEEEELQLQQQKRLQNLLLLQRKQLQNKQQLQLQLQLQIQQQHHHQQKQNYYREYSLLGPGMTFELPCLRAAAERHNLRKLSFLS